MQSAARTLPSKDKDRSHRFHGQLLEAGLLRLQRERQIEHGGRNALIGDHRLEAKARRTEGLNGDLILPDALQLEHLIEQKREGRIRRVDHNRLPAQIRIGTDLRLYDQIVPAVIAAQHDSYVDLGLLGHGNGIIDGSVNDLIATLCEPIAQLLRAGRYPLVHVQPMLGKKSFLLGRVQRQILNALKHHGRDAGLGPRGRQRNFRRQHPATRELADKLLDERLATPFKADANDFLYQWDASRDYNPAPRLERIEAALLAINSADDERNPPELAIMERELKRVRNGRMYLIPASEETRGHGTTAMAKFWKRQLEEFLQKIPAG